MPLGMCKLGAVLVKGDILRRVAGSALHRPAEPDEIVSGSGGDGHAVDQAIVGAPKRIIRPTVNIMIYNGFFILVPSVYSRHKNRRPVLTVK